MKKVVFYVDGYNLYFGIKAKGWKKYYWLDLEKLAITLIKLYPEQILEKT